MLVDEDLGTRLMDQCVLAGFYVSLEKLSKNAPKNLFFKDVVFIKV